MSTTTFDTSSQPTPRRPSLQPAREGAPLGEPELLEPGRNVARVERAERVGVFYDSASYFDALVDALREARQTIYIAAWDLHSGVQLRRGEDGCTLREVLKEAMAARPGLRVYMMLWGKTFPYSALGEWFQEQKVTWSLPDDRFAYNAIATPPRASAHQKVVVVDDVLAFVGGVDLAQHRWDTIDHEVNHPQRTGPRGTSYGPFHDVHGVLSGDAARAFGEVFRHTWEHTFEGDAALVTPWEAAPIWPRGVEPLFEDVPVGVGCNRPSWAGEEARHLEALWGDLIDSARDHLYVETQYLAHEALVDRVVARLRREDCPEMVFVLPLKPGGTLPEELTIGRLTDADAERMRENDLHDKLRLVTPKVCEEGEEAWPYVHAKVAVVDDRVLRLGSSNLAQRSTGSDNELDCVIEAAGARQVRDRLLAAHLGLSQAQVRDFIDRTGSMVELIDFCDSNRSLVQRPQDNPPPLPQLTQMLVNPKRSLASESFSEFARDAAGHLADHPAKAALIALVMLVMLASLIGVVWGIAALVT